MKLEIIEESPISMAELKNILEERSKKEELNFRAARTLDYLREFVNLKIENVKELEKKLESLNISRLKKEFIIKIIDLMPETIDDLKAIMQGYPVNLSQEDMKKIIEALH